MATRDSSSSSSGKQTIGSLGRADAAWMSCHAHELVDAVPVSGVEWRWSETELSESQLRQLYRRGMIEKVQSDPALYRTRRETIEAIAAYGRFDVEDVGVQELQLPLSRF